MQIPPVFADGLTIVGERGVYTFSYPEITKEFFGYYATRLDNIIATVADGERVDAQDAYIKFSPDKEKMFIPIKEKSGKKVDTERLKDDILSALSVGGGSIKVAYQSIEPRRHEKDLEKNVVLRSRFSTDFSSSTSERSHNVSKACYAVSGAVLDIGEEFSFNGTVGKRNEERGYKSAKIISDGNFTDGIGGGVCQVSTTLYNAALLAGLTVTEYHPHTLSVSYVENSFDAMVSYGTSDLKIRNDTGSPIYIKGAIEGRNVVFYVYGIKSEYTYERVSKVVSTEKANVKYVYDPTMDENEYVVVTPPKDGIKSQGYLIKKKNGKIVGEKLLRSDSYRSVEGLIERGSVQDVDQN